MTDEGVATIEEMWDRQAAAEERYSTPYLDLTREDVVAFARGAPGPVALGTVFPAQLLLDVVGKPVLCLASAGGQQTVLFGLAGARVTVLDISAGQLTADQRAAAHYGYTLDAVKGDMRDLSMFADESFDLIYQPISACFIPDLVPLYREAFRVLRRGGRYKVAHCNPATYAVSFTGGDNGWDGKGYRIAEPYGGGLIRMDVRGRENLCEGAPTGEHVHLLSDVFGGLIAVGFTIEQVLEDPRHLAGPGDAERGSHDHRVGTIAEYFAVVCSKVA